MAISEMKHSQVLIQLSQFVVPCELPSVVGHGWSFGNSMAIQLYPKVLLCGTGVAWSDPEDKVR